MSEYLVNFYNVYILVKYTIYFVKYFISLFMRVLDALLSDNINNHLIYADMQICQTY